MRKAVGDKLGGAAKLSTPANIKQNAIKKRYDKNGNDILEEGEWYDWRTDFVLFRTRMQNVSDKYKSRQATCPKETLSCNETEKSNQCSN
jgi:hypothetical protein